MRKEKSERFDEVVAKMVELKILSREDVRRMVPDFDKPAGARCQHQRHAKGCAIYNSRPFGCRAWSCRWLTGEDTADLSRPDRSRYVIDMAPDFVEATDNATKAINNIPVIQVWLDPKFPNAHRDPALRAFLERRGREGYAALIRYDSSDGFVLFPPALTGGQWLEKHSAAAGPEHTVEEKIAALDNI
jgi:hypothetical protein